MNLKDQLIRLELAKKLKELGVKQASLFHYVPGNIQNGYEGEVSISPSQEWSLWTQLYKPDSNDYDF